MDFAIISLIISSFAIIISFYFSFTSSYKGILDRYNDCITEIDRILINNPELIAIYDECKIETKKNDELFMNKMEAFIYLHLNYFENAYFHYLCKKSLLLRRQKCVWCNFIKEFFKNKYCVTVFNENKDLYDSSFVIYIKKIINKL